MGDLKAAGSAKRLFTGVLRNGLRMGSLGPTNGTILTLHRFGSGLGHTPPERLFDVLSALRDDGIRFVPLGSIVEARTQGRPIAADSVALTIDDGYADVEDAAAVFYSLECPATVFVTTGFVDGTSWMWWDRIRFCLEEHPVGVFSHKLESGPVTWSWGGGTPDPPMQRQRWRALWSSCRRPTAMRS